MKTIIEFVVTWFPPDRPTRHVSRRTLEDAQREIVEREIEHMAPMIEKVTLTVSETREIVWNSIDAPGATS